MPRFPKGVLLARRIALVLLALAAPSSLACFCLGSPAAAWIGAFASGVIFPMALMALGAVRGGRLDRTAAPILITALVLAGGWLAVLGLPDGGPDVAGLPAATALMIFVMVPAPLLITGLAYALTFNRLGLRPEDLERVRAAKRPGAGD